MEGEESRKGFHHYSPDRSYWTQSTESSTLLTCYAKHRGSTANSFIHSEHFHWSPIRTPSPPNQNEQHVLWSALCSNYRNEVCIRRVLLNVTEAEFDRYSDWMRCGVITIHSPRPLWLTNTLHSDRQIWLPQKLGRGMPHIQSAWERGIWGCGTEGMILTWAHFSRHPPPTPQTPLQNLLVTSYPQPGHQTKPHSCSQTHKYGL